MNTGQRKPTERARYADGFDHRFIHPIAVDLFPDHVLRDRTTVLPSISFAGYHPDLIYLQERGEILKGPLGDYHSAIAWVSFRQGITPSETVRFYTRGVFFVQAGYLDLWTPAKERMLSTYASAGLPIDDHFYEWTRAGPFMHAINHPKIHAVASVAATALERIGVPVYASADAIPTIS